MLNTDQQQETRTSHPGATARYPQVIPHHRAKSEQHQLVEAIIRTEDVFILIVAVPLQERTPVVAGAPVASLALGGIVPCVFASSALAFALAFAIIAFDIAVVVVGVVTVSYSDAPILIVIVTVIIVIVIIIAILSVGGLPVAGV